jgi:beta-mannosidase
MARARTLGAGTARPIGGSWAIAAAPPGRAQSPSDLDDLDLDWIPCDGPMPVAAALRAAGRWALDHPRDFDAEEWWYRCRFPIRDPGARTRLRFEGLATIADVWLNGTHILRSDSMFLAHAVAVDTPCVDNDLVIRFQALAPLLAVRRPRPNWRTGLVAHQQLRWHRTTLLGRIPAWCPPVAPVGPWRPVLLEPADPLRVERADVRVGLDGHDGVVQASIQVTGSAGAGFVTGTLAVGQSTAPVVCQRLTAGEIVLDATVHVPHVERWWPHTHGPQPLFQVRLSIAWHGGHVEIDLGRVGFRTVEVEQGADRNGFGLVVNGVAVFCRGTCWTPLDLALLDADAADYRSALECLRDAGMNMIRVGGTMAYETDAFHDLCDELGILVWQDFMFANMDYPSSDEAFARSVTIEARQILEGLQGRPSLAVVCGNSEVEQQAAMMGLPAERWTNPLFAELLPALARSLVPGVAWLPSTPTGGALPFQADRGVTHYYGVGAYRRPLDEARRAGVRFATECLAFSNIPDPAMVERLLGEGVMAMAGLPSRSPAKAGWKARVPRDGGADWDFEDVRDHYVEVLFGVEPDALRRSDPERYLALGRVATGEVMLRTFAEWRRPGSTCRGGLVWFGRDLWPGAGWGVVDSAGRPKAAYWYLKRALAPVALLAADEGLNGLWFHAVNDTPEPIDAELRVTLYRKGRACGASGSAVLTIPARGARSVHADMLFDGFLDLTYAYRFGPPGHDVVAATLRRQASGTLLAAAHCFPCGLPSMRESTLGLAARAEPIAGGYALSLEADRFAHAVAIEAEGFVPDDSYLHLEPGEPRRLVLRAEVAGRRLRGRVSALNGSSPVAIDCVEVSGAD